MPNKCCIVGCNTGYDSYKGKNHVFSIPKDETLRLKWLKAIGRKDFEPGKWAVVCHKHFKASDIMHDNGVTKVKLREGAIPSICLNSFYTKKTQNEIRSSPRKSRVIKNASSVLIEDNSSDDDVPLETIRNQSLNTNSTKQVTQDTNIVLDDCDKSVKRNFKQLLEDYEQLKERSVGLSQEIKVLEGVNIELKCKIFK